MVEYLAANLADQKAAEMVGTLVFLMAVRRAEMMAVMMVVQTVDTKVVC